MAERFRVFIDTEQIVFATDDPPALIGFDAPGKKFSIEGWKWDDRFWTTDEQENQEAVLPTLYNPGTFGLTPDFFQSGIGQGQDLKVLDIQEFKIDDKLTWTTILNHGEFFSRQNRRYLYADDSIIQYIDPSEDESGRNAMQLDYALKETIPISIETYTRDINTDNFQVFCDIEPQLEFTGKLDPVAGDGSRLPTFQNGEILWDNVDTDQWEAMVIYDLEPQKLLFNKDFIHQVGRVMTTFSERNILERMGETNDGIESFILRTKHFPILRDSSLHVYMVNEDLGTFVEWTRVENFDNSGPTDTHFTVDRDLGLIIFGDNIQGAIPPLFHAVYITYKYTFKVEYEAKGTRDIVVVRDINLNPTTNNTTQGFVFLTETKINIGSVTLTTNEPTVIGTEDIFGPITMGNDFGLLTATVLDTVNEPIPDLEVQFSIENIPAVGILNGTAATVTATTNSNGQAIAFYNPPSLIDDLGTYSVTLDNAGKTLVLDDIDANLIDPTQVFLFQVRKDDPIFGKIGADTSIGEVPWDIQFAPLSILGRKLLVYSFNEFATHPRTGALGAFFPLQPTNIDFGFRLNFPEPLQPVNPNFDLSDTNPVAGYWVVSTKQVRITASVFSRFLGRKIISNQLTFLVSLPDHLLGVFTDSQGQRIPYGFRIKDNNLVASSALGGANFLTVNDPYMDNPLGHTFTVII